MGIWSITIESSIQLTIELAIDLSHSSHESTWNRMDRHGLTLANMNEHGLAWTTWISMK